MSYSIKFSVLAVKLALLTGAVSSSFVMADDAPQPNMDFEVITITHQRYHGLEVNQQFAQGKTSEPDLANWLTSVPGANVNANGPVTGVAQYRGLYGDRLAIALDGHPVIGAGPNAMDTPLSYSTPLIVDSMTVYRGVTPVSAAIDSLAGSIDVKMRKAEVASENQWLTTGDLQAGYRSNNHAKTLSTVVNSSKDALGVMLYANLQSGDDLENGDGVTVSPTRFEKRQFGGDIRYLGGGSELGFSYHYTDTQDSGTPALPMDIEYIFSHRVGIDGSFSLEQWQGVWTLGWVDANHGMTNFLLRENDNPAKYRRNHATADTLDFSAALNKLFAFGELEIGIDGYLAEHDSVISNPNNAMFEVINFNQVQDDRVGIFLQWQQQYDNTRVQLGARLKQVQADADQVATSMAMMPVMGELAAELRDAFNNADRSVSDNLFDVALNVNHLYSSEMSFNLGLGIKSRAASYQARYLWTPMESTGGLADGNTYIGNIDLAAEHAYQLDLGINYQNKHTMVSPHLFYQQIDDYIQGTPLTMQQMSAKMIAKMTSGDTNPLQFNNVDAKLYGMDVNWRFALSENIVFSGVASYVRGQRRDIDDELYRIAPLNTQLNLTYNTDNMAINATWQLVSRQNKVSMTNDEQQSAGYGVINLDVQYFVDPQLTVRAGVDNLFDRSYQTHLSGYNRVKGTDIPVMSRIPAEGISAWLEATYSF